MGKSVEEDRIYHANWFVMTNIREVVRADIMSSSHYDCSSLLFGRHLRDARTNVCISACLLILEVLTARQCQIYFGQTLSVPF